LAVESVIVSLCVEEASAEVGKIQVHACVFIKPLPHFVEGSIVGNIVLIDEQFYCLFWKTSILLCLFLCAGNQIEYSWSSQFLALSNLCILLANFIPNLHTFTALLIASISYTNTGTHFSAVLEQHKFGKG
jgi:hypothetical protein